MRQTWLPRLRRTLIANLRVFFLLWRRFRLSLTLFLLIIVVGSLLLWLLYIHPETGQHISFGEALYAALGMLFFQAALPFPHGPLGILFFVIPILGFSVVVEGLVSFSLLLWDRRNPSGEWNVALASTYSGHVIVCGLGHVGYRVVRQLLEFGQEVVGVEKDSGAQFLDRVRERGVPVVVGDATDRMVLLQVGGDRAQAIVVATNNDLVNLEIAMNVRQLNPDIRVVLRMFDGDLAERFGEVLGIRTALSASAIAAPAFATAAIRAGVTHSFFLEGELLHVSELILCAEGQLPGKTIRDLESSLDLSVAFLQRGQKRDMHPADEIALQAEDKVVVFATLEQLGQLERLNCGSAASRGRR